LNKDIWNLSEDEVGRISRLIETLNQSTFDYLQIEVGELKLTLSKGHMPDVYTAPAVPAASPLASAAQQPATRPAAPNATTDDGTVTIVAPVVGRFYSLPEPGAPPFVTVGSEISEDSTVGLIEVMKTFNAVRAGVNGIITEICAQDAALVEYGQILFRVRPKS